MRSSGVGRWACYLMKGSQEKFPHKVVTIKQSRKKQDNESSKYKWHTAYTIHLNTYTHAPLHQNGST